MELKGFSRVMLQPGEEREIRFSLGYDHVRIWKDGRWVMEPGQVQVMIGASSTDIDWRPLWA
jgi:beta-glucosidase